MSLFAARSALLGFALVGCGSTTVAPPERPAVVAAQGVARYLPLQNATVFSYDTRIEPAGERGLLVLEVRRRNADAAELVVAGRAQRLALRADAIELVSGGFLLKAPLTTGAEFRGDFGVVRVTRTGFSERVPAGEFSDCIETVESNSVQTMSRKTSTVFCANVGIVSRSSEVESDEGQALESMQLRAFGAKFEPTL